MALDAIELTRRATGLAPQTSRYEKFLEIRSADKDWPVRIHRVKALSHPIANRVLVTPKDLRGLVHGVTPVDLDAARIKPLHPSLAGGSELLVAPSFAVSGVLRILKTHPFFLRAVLHLRRVYPRRALCQLCANGQGRLRQVD